MKCSLLQIPVANVDIGNLQSEVNQLVAGQSDVTKLQSVKDLLQNYDAKINTKQKALTVHSPMTMDADGNLSVQNVEDFVVQSDLDIPDLTIVFDNKIAG